MPSIAVIGAQWGDEGKAKVIDLVSGSADLIARYQGGANAGHTVRVGNDKFIFHLVPTGLLHEEKVGVLGNGVALCPTSLFQEIDRLQERGLRIEERLFISGRAQIILPYHLEMEAWIEYTLDDQRIGTTLRGIGPCYLTKIMRTGIQLADVLDEQVFLDKAETNLKLALAMGMLKGNLQEHLNKTAAAILPLASRLGGMICDTSKLIQEALEEGKRVVYEGAQGTMLDVDHGTYPFVTSSNATVGGVCSGLGLPPCRVGKVLGISKAYVTRVGQGPMPTEANQQEDDMLRLAGEEFGATTGRPRRCGWLDLVALQYAHQVNHFDGVALTKLDVLDTLPEIKVCTGYRYQGDLITEYPLEGWILAECEPEYEVLPGWQQPTTNAQTFDELPPKAQHYVRWVSDFLGAPVSIVSIGAERAKTIVGPDAGFADWVQLDAVES